MARPKKKHCAAVSHSSRGLGNVPGNGPPMSPTQEWDPQIEPQLISSQEGVPVDPPQSKEVVGTDWWIWTVDEGCQLSTETKKNRALHENIELW